MVHANTFNAKHGLCRPNLQQTTRGRNVKQFNLHFENDCGRLPTFAVVYFAQELLDRTILSLLAFQGNLGISN